MTIQQNNELTLRKHDLIKSVGTLFNNISSRNDFNGSPVVHYNDEHDSFSVIIDQTQKGYSVDCSINGQKNNKLKGRFFESSTSIGKILILSATQKESSVVDDNSYILSYFS